MNNFWKAKPLKKVIHYEIDYHKVDEEKVKPAKRLKIQEANDEFFVKNESISLFYSKLMLISSFGMAFFFFLISFGMKNGTFPLKGYLIVTPFLVASLFFLTIHFIAPVKEVVLDRINGKISYPRLFANSQYRTIQFDSLYVYETMTSSGDFSVTGKKIYIKDRKYNYQWDLESNKPNEYWSFMVWYMDKNRPLPPGTAFDPYRQKDFERRKNEGFPKPLYPSTIPTPEATPEQQKERENIGGW